LLLPEDAERQMNQMLRDMLKSGILPARGFESGLKESARK
jgi:hypothetical protein